MANVSVSWLETLEQEAMNGKYGIEACITPGRKSQSYKACYLRPPRAKDRYSRIYAVATTPSTTLQCQNA